jgi:hypothetical protein
MCSHSLATDKGLVGLKHLALATKLAAKGGLEITDEMIEAGLEAYYGIAASPSQ